MVTHRRSSCINYGHLARLTLILFINGGKEEADKKGLLISNIRELKQYAQHHNTLMHFRRNEIELRTTCQRGNDTDIELVIYHSGEQVSSNFYHLSLFGNFCC